VKKKKKKATWHSGGLAMEDDVRWWLRLWQRWWLVLAASRGRRRIYRGEKELV
jgi:hypothetical protein